MIDTAISNIAEVIMGQAPPGAAYNEDGIGLPLIAGASDFGDLTPMPSRFTSDSPKRSRIDDIILCVRATIGDLNWADREYCLGRGVAALRPDDKQVDRKYLWRALEANTDELRRLGRGATFLQITKKDIANFHIPIPSMSEQQRIATILDQADALRRLRRQSLSRLSNLGQAIFFEMFGDPARNPHALSMRPLGEVASKFSDGPFGSNLKSSHYVDEGVRVIRLQNIGVNEFIDRDKAYISEEHFASLQKHECLPGDVIVGTLGDPNLRACIQPDWLPQALNKADCVQIRVDPSVASNEYICALLNLPSVERMAQNLVLGQTRARISMGRLRELRVPIAPKDKQDEYAAIVVRLRAKSHYFERSLKESASLFTSLQHRAFRGEL